MAVFWLATLLGIAQRFVSSRHPVEGLSGWFRSRHCSRIARHLRPQQRIAVVDPSRDLDDRASADDRRNWEPLVNCDRRCNHNRAWRGAPHPALGGQWPPYTFVAYLHCFYIDQALPKLADAPGRFRPLLYSDPSALACVGLSM